VLGVSPWQAGVEVVRLQGKTQRAHPARLIVCEREERDAEADDPESSYVRSNRLCSR
jgi:hypothetical protein